MQSPGKLIHLLVLVLISAFTHAQPVIPVWKADNGDGTYRNPVIHADYSDPDAIRVGTDYYMISSSFNHVPGLPILHSKDLVNWSLIGHALAKLPSPHFDTVQHGGGVWAPAIRFHNNEFYIFYPDPDFGIYLVKAKNITGPWSEPLLVLPGKGLIDPCPLWDNNGKVYLVHAYAGSRAGIKSIIVIRELNKEATKVTGDAVMVYDGHEADPTIEGPKLYKRKGWYYIFAPAGGVSTGWQTVLRSKKIYGPYERKVVMDQGTTPINGPHQGAWINTSAGEDWFLHFQDKEAFGRVVHLQPMKWINDWPVIGEDKDGDGKGEPVLAYKKPNVGKTYPIITPAESDEFNDTRSGLQWQWQANQKEGWAFPTTSGSVRMFSVYQADDINSIWNTPSILGQKIPADEFTATMKVTFKPRHKNEKFGLVVLGTGYAFISIEKGEDGLYIVCRENSKADKGGTEEDGATFPLKASTCWLRVKMEKDGSYLFSFSEDNERYTDIVKKHIAKPGKWVGAKLGIFCLRNTITNDAGYADVDWFRITKD